MLQKFIINQNMKKLFTVLLTIFFIIGGIVSAIIIYFIFTRTITSYETFVPYKKLVRNVSLSTANTHLWLEEWVAGDVSVNYDRSVDGQLRETKRMLTNAYYNKGTYTVSEDPKMKAYIKKCMNAIDNFIVLTQRRKELKLMKMSRINVSDDFTLTDSSIGSDLETRYDNTYEDILSHFTNLSNYIDLVEKQQSEDHKRSFIQIFVLIAVFFVFSLSFEIIGRIQSVRKSKIDSRRLALEMSRIEKMTTFIDSISVGKYGTQLDLNVENDHIATSIIQMRDKLKKNAEEEEKRKLDNQQQNWITQGLSELGDIIYQSSGNVEELSSLIIKNLVNYIDANQGGIFILNDEDKGNEFLELVAAFAYDRKKYMRKIIHFGEGLVGACAVEKETMYMTEFPDNYIEITSGLGTANPTTILIVPLKLEDRIFGVIELASFNLLLPHVINFVEQIAESIASTLSTVKTNARTADLLKLTQIQAEEKVSQEEELRQNMEEMQAIQEESEKKKIELLGLINAIDHTTLRAEFDLNGNLIIANENFAKLMGYNIEELQEKNIDDIISEDERKKFERVWAQVCADKKHHELVRRKNRYGELLWLLISYTPIKDAESNINKILFLATDITSQKELEIASQNIANELKEKQNELLKEKVLLQEMNKKQKNTELQLLKTIEDAKNQAHKANKRRRELEIQDEVLKLKSEDLDILKSQLQKKENELNEILSIKKSKR